MPLLVLTALVWSLCADRATGGTADAGWRVGLARVCISPREPVWLHGYAGTNRFRPFDGVLDDLHAKALAIQCADGRPALLIAADLCVLREPEETELCEILVRATGLERDRILLNWSHTHSAPIIGSSEQGRYPQSEEDRRRTLAYTQWLWTRLADTAVKALSAMQPARLSWGVGRVDFVRNRRLFDGDGAYLRMGSNPEGHTDPSVPVLRIDGADGRLRAVVFGCACHPVTLGNSSVLLSGDYPNHARMAIERRHPGVETLFIQGCGADANPDPRATKDEVEWVRRHGEALGGEVCRVLEGGLAPVRGPLRTAFRRVDLPLEPMPPRERLEQLAAGPFWQSHSARGMLEALQGGETIPAFHPAPVALWQFGGDLTLVAVSGEVVSDYVPLIAGAIGAERVWVAGYSNQVFGYLPSARIAREGGYETVGLIAPRVGRFSADAERALISELRRIHAGLQP